MRVLHELRQFSDGMPTGVLQQGECRSMNGPYEGGEKENGYLNSAEPSWQLKYLRMVRMYCSESRDMSDPADDKQSMEAILRRIRRLYEEDLLQEQGEKERSRQ